MSLQLAVITTPMLSSTFDDAGLDKLPYESSLYGKINIIFYKHREITVMSN